MGSKVATYLQTHLSGEVFSSGMMRTRYATDDSVLTLMPQLVAYPRSTADLRKIARFSWQLAEKNHLLPLTPRGYGSNTVGSAIGTGVIVSLPAHMNQILELDTKQRLVRVQPGLSAATLLQTLHTHGLDLPIPKHEVTGSTVGGLIANGNVLGSWVDKLEVVLPNGEIIQTGAISKKELEKRKGLPTLEGELYRSLDGIRSDFAETIKADQNTPRLTYSSIGFNILRALDGESGCNLTPLFIGSQGVLGMISEIILTVSEHELPGGCMTAAFTSVEDASAAIAGIQKLNPQELRIMNGKYVAQVSKLKGKNLSIDTNSDSATTPEVLLLVALGKRTKSTVKGKLDRRKKHAQKAIENAGGTVDFVASEDQYDQWQSIFESPASIRFNELSGKVALPCIDNCAVPLESYRKFMVDAEKLLQKNHVEQSIWGDLQDGTVHILPMLDVGKIGDRQKVVKLMNDYFTLVLSYGGTIGATQGEGRLRSLFVTKQLSADMTNVHSELKKAFDPYGMMNPGVKQSIDTKQLVAMLRKDYSPTHRADELFS